MLRKSCSGCYGDLLERNAGLPVNAGRNIEDDEESEWSGSTFSRKGGNEDSGKERDKSLEELADDVD